MRFPVLVAGITPACAGISPFHCDDGCTIQDHPRVRGDKAPAHDQQAAKVGSPPRARG